MNFPSSVPGDIALVLHATHYAAKAHHGQVRTYTNEPYIMHAITVAYGVATRTMDPHVIAAAVLHDVIEDTAVTHGDLISAFGERVANLVLELTDVYTKESFPHMNRRERKRMEALRFAGASADAQLIKAYDLLDNTHSITQHDPGFATVYLEEKRFLIAQMNRLDPHVRILIGDI